MKQKKYKTVEVKARRYDAPTVATIDCKHCDGKAFVKIDQRDKFYLHCPSCDHLGRFNTERGQAMIKSIVKLDNVVEIDADENVVEIDTEETQAPTEQVPAPEKKPVEKKSNFFTMEL